MILFSFYQAILVSAVSPMLIGIIRKTKAKLQFRQGASIFQPYADLRKLFSKDEVISSDASIFFRGAPYLIFSLTLLIATAIPVAGIPSVGTTTDFLVIAYLFGLSAFTLALAGIDTGSAFGGFGSSRELSLGAIVEAVLLFALLPLVLIAQSTSIPGITSALSSLPFSSYLSVFLAFMAFLVAMVTETARVPVDNPATHLELTMIHEAMILEYSGKRLALVEWASANKYVLFLALGTNLFFPYLLSEANSIQHILIGTVVFLAKAIIFSIALAILESSIAKLRIFKVPDLLFTGIVLGAIALIFANV